MICFTFAELHVSVVVCDLGVSIDVEEGSHEQLFLVRVIGIVGRSKRGTNDCCLEGVEPDVGLFH